MAELIPSAGRSALVAALLQQAQRNQGRPSYSLAGSMDIAAAPILASLLAKREGQAVQEQQRMDQVRQQALAGQLSRALQPGAQGKAARRAALITSGAMPNNPLAQAILGAQATQAFSPPAKPDLTDDLKEYGFYVDQEKAAGRTPDDFTTWDRTNRRSGATTIDVTEKMPPPPQGMAYQPDPNSPFGYKLVPIPGARDTRTEAQQKAELLGTRMQALDSDIRNEAPSVGSQMAFQFAQGGGIVGAVANRALGADEQKHFNAARGWLAGVLRGDTGATIQPFEIQEYYPTFFPVPGDTKEVVDQKKRLREVTLQAIKGNSGRPQEAAAPSVDLSGKTDAELMELAK